MIKARVGNMIQVHGLTKKVGGRELIKNVSFHVEPGEVFGIIGQNGAGKTTIIKCIVGLYKYQSGEILIDGKNIKTGFEMHMNKIGCIIEGNSMYEHLSGRDNLKLVASMQEDPVDLDSIIETVRLGKRIDEKVKTYSLGMKQRLGVAQALVKNVTMLIMDEPTNGLDPVGINDIKMLIKELAKKGVTVIISSHILAELESVCDRYAVVHDGEIVEIRYMDQLRAEGVNMEESFLKTISLYDMDI